MKTEVLLNHNNFYLKYDMPVPMVIIPMVVISMSSLVKKKNLITRITRLFKEIITLIICFTCFYYFVKQLARAAFAQNVQFSHIFKRDKLMLRIDPFHC